MRVDKFINIVNLTKRRSIADDMCKKGVVLINSKIAKPSKDVKVTDIITIKYLDYSKSYRVLHIPSTKTIPKSKSSEYIEEITSDL